MKPLQWIITGVAIAALAVAALFVLASWLDDEDTDHEAGCECDECRTDEHDRRAW